MLLVITYDLKDCKAYTAGEQTCSEQKIACFFREEILIKFGQLFYSQACISRCVFMIFYVLNFSLYLR